MEGGAVDADADADLQLALAMSLEQQQPGAVCPDDPSATPAAAGAATAGVAAAAPALGSEPALQGPPEPSVDLVVRWSGGSYAFSLPESATVADVKRCLEERTGVLTKRQKLIGVMCKGKVAPDDMSLGSVKLSKKIMLIGTREESIIKEPAPEDMPDVFNDMDIDYSGDSGVRTPANLQQLQQRCAPPCMAAQHPPQI
eukprot:COSAG01_NODE_13961_length_1513_cov_133.034653_1_plen_199_part_00